MIILLLVLFIASLKCKGNCSVIESGYFFLAKSFHINFPVGSVIKKNSLKVKLFFAFTFESYL